MQQSLLPLTLRWLSLLALLRETFGLVVRQQAINSTSREGWLFYDLGFFDGRDSLSYLNQGMRVVAVEADPSLVKAGEANPALAPFIANGKLKILNYAIAMDVAAKPAMTTFYMSKCTKEWNSFYSWVGCRSCTPPHLEDKTKSSCVPTQVLSTPCTQVFKDFGVPVYMKGDMEGAEAACFQALWKYPVDKRPNLISGELADPKLVDVFASLGYTSFKIVRQAGSHSGGWGDQAVDCRWGAQWRSQASANAELQKINDKVNPNPPTDGCPSFQGGMGVWYDVHASRLPSQIA